MSKYLFILAEKANHSIKAMCRVLMVSTSAFYDWLAREPSERDREDELLATHIRAIHKASKGTYGSPRVHAELRRGGFDVSRKRVIRIMQRLGLRARRPRKWKTTTVSTPGATVAPNRLKRDFTAKAPNEVWTADITYVWTWEGLLYLAAIVDLFSRRVVGWAAADHMRVDLVLEAFDKAVLSRRPPAGLMFHSDRGSQFTSHRFLKALADHVMVASMSRRGDASTTPSPRASSRPTRTSSSTCSPGPRDVRRSRPPPTSSTPGTTPGASTPRWGPVEPLCRAFQKMWSRS